MNDEYISIESARQNYLSRYNINANLLETSKFLFVSHNAPWLNFFAQSVTLPAVTASEVMHETPSMTMWRHGDKIQYEPLVVSFLIDEDLKVWEELHNWVRGYTAPVSGDEYKQAKKRGIYVDLTCIFLKNSYQSNFQFSFYNSMVTSVGPLAMETTGDATSIMSTDVTIRFDYFDIRRGSI